MSVYYPPQVPYQAVHHPSSLKSLPHQQAYRASAKQGYQLPAHVRAYDAPPAMHHSQHQHQYASSSNWTEQQPMRPFNHGAPVQGLPMNHSAPGPFVGPQVPLSQQARPQYGNQFYQEQGTYQNVPRKSYAAAPAPYAPEEAMYVSKRGSGFPGPLPGHSSMPAGMPGGYQQQRSQTPNSGRYMDARPGSAETVSSDPVPMTPPRPALYPEPVPMMPERHSARVAHVDSARSNGSETPATPSQDPVNVFGSKPARINPDTSAQYVMSTTGQEICFVATAVNADKAPVVAVPKSSGSPASTPKAGKYGRSGSESSSMSSGSELRLDASIGGVLGLGSAGDQMALQVGAGQHGANGSNLMSMDQLAQMMQDVASLLQGDAGDSSLGLGRPPRADSVAQRSGAGLVRAGPGSNRQLRY